jgi:hypothetical protein
MKLTLVFLALVIGISAQTGQRTTMYGDRSRGEFYPVACGMASTIATENLVVFESREDAERRGFQFTPCPVDPRSAKDKTIKVSKRHAARGQLTVVMLTQEPNRWLGRFVTVHANLMSTDVWAHGEKTSSFRIVDGASGLYVWMDQQAAAPLADLVRKVPEGQSVAGSFTIYLDPKNYQNGNEMFARLVSWRVK